jgi:hypothetical protein
LAAGVRTGFALPLRARAERNMNSVAQLAAMAAEEMRGLRALYCEFIHLRKYLP